MSRVLTDGADLRQATAPSESKSEPLLRKGVEAINEGRYKEGLATMMILRSNRKYIVHMLFAEGVSSLADEFEYIFTPDGAESPFVGLDKEKLREALTDILHGLIIAQAAEERREIQNR